jgi:hypothetical protein
MITLLAYNSAYLQVLKPIGKQKYQQMGKFLYDRYDKKLGGIIGRDYNPYFGDEQTIFSSIDSTYEHS